MWSLEEVIFGVGVDTVSKDEYGPPYVNVFILRGQSISLKCF